MNTIAATCIARCWARATRGGSHESIAHCGDLVHACTSRTAATPGAAAGATSATVAQVESRVLAEYDALALGAVTDTYKQVVISFGNVAQGIVSSVIARGVWAEVGGILLRKRTWHAQQQIKYPQGR